MIMEWLVKRWADRLIGKIDPAKPITDADLAQLENPKWGTVTLSDDGVQVQYPKSVDFARWDEIREVFAYKRDLLTTDMICLALCTADDRPILEPHAEMVGYVKLCRELEKRLPGFQDKYAKWLLSSPAFDTRPTTIWKLESPDEGVAKH